MTDLEIKAYQKLLKDLSKLELKAKQKSVKERQELENNFIVFRGVECYTEKDIIEIYGFGDCTEKQCDNAIEKLRKKKKEDINGKTFHEYYSELLLKITCNIAEEIKDEKKRK